MVGEIHKRTARATDRFPAFDWPASDAKTSFSKEFWAVAWFSAIGLMVSLGLVYATLGTGFDLTAGAVTIETTTVRAASAGN